MRKILFILGELDDADVDWLMRVGYKEQIETGSRLIQEGHPVDAFYVVVSGEFTGGGGGVARARDCSAQKRRSLWRDFILR